MRRVAPRLRSQTLDHFHDRDPDSDACVSDSIRAITPGRFDSGVVSTCCLRVSLAMFFLPFSAAAGSRATSNDPGVSRPEHRPVEHDCWAPASSPPQVNKQNGLAIILLVPEANVYPISRAAAAARITKPALLNYIHRELVVHGGSSPANGSARKIPLLGIYEAAWIGALGRVGIGPSVGAALFPLLRQHVLDRNCDDPLLALIAVEQETPAIEIVRGWSSATNIATRLPSMVLSIVNLSTLFGSVDAALHATKETNYEARRRASLRTPDACWSLSATEAATEHSGSA